MRRLTILLFVLIGLLVLMISTRASYPAGAMVLLETQRPTGTSLTFSSLGRYSNLEIQYSARSDQSANNTVVNLTFNGDTGSNYDRELIQGFSGTANASEALAQTSIAIGNVVSGTGTANTPGVGTIQVFDYRGTTFQKMAISTNGWPRLTTTGNFFMQVFTGRWRSTAAITSITLTLASGNFVSGSVFSLYGIP